MSKIFVVMIAGLCWLLPSVLLASSSNGSIDAVYKYAWGENLGWINFKPTAGGLAITDTAVSGYAWSQQFGWINFSPTNGGVTNNCAGNLGGKAWSSSLGWVDFSGASINANGRFTGLINTGNTKAGRVNFDCTNCRVETDWRPCAVRVTCGNGVVESGEQCDDGGNNGLCPKQCSTSCQRNNCAASSGQLLPQHQQPTSATQAATATTPTQTRFMDVIIDGVVDIIDFNAMMVNWGKKGFNDADLSHDYVVDFYDFNLLMANWGRKYAL